MGAVAIDVADDGAESEVVAPVVGLDAPTECIGPPQSFRFTPRRVNCLDNAYTEA